MEKERSCPSCNRLIGAQTPVIGGESASPNEGDISICAYCGDFLIFNKDLSLRQMGLEEEMALKDDCRSQLMKIRAAILLKKAVKT
jgi:hypothetical protein